MAGETAPKYILYVRELEFVACADTGLTIDEADELLLQGLGEGWIGWTCRELDYGNDSFNSAQLERVKQTLVRAGHTETKIETYLSETLRFFWRPAEHTRIARTNNSATRTGPPWVVGSHLHLEAVDGKLVPIETCWPIYLFDLPPVTLKAKLVRLYHDDVVAMLRRVGSLPLQKEATPDAKGTLVAVEAPDIAAFTDAPAASNKKLEPKKWLEWKYKADPRCLDDRKRLHEQMVADADAGIVSEVWDWKKSFGRRVREYEQQLRTDRKSKLPR
jgi:hypothetical protein